MTATTFPLLRNVRIVGNYFRGQVEKNHHDALAPGDKLRLELEPNNPHDPFAVKVCTTVHIGYIPAEMSAVFHACGLDRLTAYVAAVTTPKGKTGKQVLINVDVCKD